MGSLVAARPAVALAAAAVALAVSLATTAVALVWLALTTGARLTPCGWGPLSGISAEKMEAAPLDGAALSDAEDAFASAIAFCSAGGTLVVCM